MGDDSQPEYALVVKQLRSLYAEVGGELRLYAFPESSARFSLDRRHFPVLGKSTIETTAQEDDPETFERITFTIDRHEPSIDVPHRKRLHNPIVRAGAMLPNRIASPARHQGAI
jgi:hypothetical protein